MNLPKVSIIVPIYNTSWNLRRCIQGVLNQTYTNIEIILVNDGSTDDSLRICQEYAQKDSRIIVVDKLNTGVSDSRNIGISYATGNYISFIDSDDWVETTYIEDFHVETLISEMSVVIQGIRYDIPNRQLDDMMFAYPSIRFESSDIKMMSELHVLNNGCPVAKLFSKNVIVDNEIYFDTKLSLNEDHLFVLNYYKYVKEFVLSANVNYHYYYNYKLPSLTKVVHSSNEYIRIARSINRSFLQLIQKHNANVSDFKECYTIFGPIQLIRATYSLFREKSNIDEFVKVIAIWNELKIDVNLLTVGDVYSKVFVRMLNANRYVFYWVQYLLFLQIECLKIFKFLIKKYLLRY